MLGFIGRLFRILNRKQRISLAFLQIFVLAMAFLEVTTISLIGPFIAVISDPENLENNKYLSQIASYFEIGSFSQFILWYGIFLLGFMAISSVVSVYGVWLLARFATSLGSEVSLLLFKNYIKSDWTFHLKTNSSEITKRLVNESQRVTSSILQPIMLINARIVLILFILTGIIIINPLVALFGAITFGVCYFVLYYVVQDILYKNGRAWSDVLALRYKIINSSFGGIRDILVLGRDRAFIDEFETSGKELARVVGANGALTQAPRYLIEFVAFGSLILLIITVSNAQSSRFMELLPVLAVYAFAALKLLPAFQQLYVGVSQIRGNIAAFEIIEADLNVRLTEDVLGGSRERFEVNSEISLEGVRFEYPGAERSALNDINMTVDANTTVGIVGASGSGKTTLLALLTGLFFPSAGSLKIDGVVIEQQNLRKWKNSIGYVPQDVFIADASLEENIAFGIPRKDIDQVALQRAVKLANLDEVVGDLEERLNTVVGERGSKLSGGQRQRVGIARALYSDPQVLIFDEATSALDGNTEKEVMDSIKSLDGIKTIIIVAHRLKTVESCNNIFVIESGALVDEGKFNDLLNGSEKFRGLAGLIENGV